VYLYHIPQVSAVPITLGLIRRLQTAFPQVVAGMKDSSGDWNNTKAVLDGTKGFRVFVGSERFLLANMRAGGVGCITATANVNAKMIAELYREWRGPDADAKQAAIDKVRDVYEKFGAIPAMKAMLGFGPLRPPLLALSSDQQAQLKAALER
jgi:4-hydroxy-tetrahydrodipicolinate synthase